MTNKLPPNYSQALKILCEAVKGCNDVKVKRKWFAKFVETYTAVPGVWELWFKTELIHFRQSNESPEEFVEFCLKFNDVGLSHFYHSALLKEAYINPNGEVFFCLPKKSRKFNKLTTYPYYEDDWCFSYNGEYKNNLENIRNGILFPHRYLSTVFQIYKECLTSPVPAQIKNIYKKNLQLFTKIKESDYQNLVNLLAENSDYNFVLQNFEQSLAENFCEKYLWKKCIKYMENHDKVAMLSVYSRYCHFFIEDMEMRQLYYYEIEQLYHINENVEVYLIDMVKIEMKFNNLTEDAALEFLKTIKGLKSETIKDCNDKLQIYFNYRNELQKYDGIECSQLFFLQNYYRDFESFKSSSYNTDNDENLLELSVTGNHKVTEEKHGLEMADFMNFEKQNFPFHSTIIQYISNCPLASYKLYKTCKYFFATKKKLLCYSLLVVKNTNGHGMQYIENSLKMTSTFINEQLLKNESFLKNYIVTSRLHIDNTINRNCFSTLLLQSCVFRIEYLKLKNQDLTIKEIDSINESCNLLAVRFIDVNIYINENFAHLEDVFRSFPCVQRFYLKSDSLIITEKSAESLANLSRKVQLQEFVVSVNSTNFRADHFCNFLTKHVANYGRVETMLDAINENLEYKMNFFKVLENFLSKWKPVDSAPIFNI